jgi:imidazolonepropionase-like amidohydrolase
MAGVLFNDVMVLDGTGAAPFRAKVMVQGNRIKSVVPIEAPLEAGDAEVVDAGGATLMPGLTEAHAHPSFANISSLHALGEIPPEEHTLITARNAKLLLDSGFTSLNSAASGKPRLDVVIRNAINAGEIPGPRMLAASPELTTSGGLGDARLLHMDRQTFSIVCDGPEEFRKCARIMCREGVDTLKINPSGDEFVPVARAEQTVMNSAEVQAVVDVARERGRRVMAHARSAESVKMCIRHGIDLINHATFTDDEAIDMLESAKDRVFVIPAIGVIYTAMYEASEWGLTPEVSEKLGMKREIENASWRMAEYKKRGIRVLPGGDYGFAWNPVGRNARDLEHFVKLFGFSPMEAIVAATRYGGQLMMKGDELGQVKPGYLADLLLVDGDPLKDVAILQDRDRLLGIMKDGQFHKRPPALPAARQLAAE